MEREKELQDQLDKKMREMERQHKKSLLEKDARQSDEVERLGVCKVLNKFVAFFGNIFSA